MGGVGNEWWKSDGNGGDGGTGGSEITIRVQQCNRNDLRVNEEDSTR